MIEQNVQVVRCQDDRMWVRMGSQSGCTACDNGQGCGAGLFARLLRRKPVIIELARNQLQVEPGQMVKLSFPEPVYLKLVLAFYGWPLLAALVGAFAGYGLADRLQAGPGLTDAVTLAGGLFGGFLALRFSRRGGKVDNVFNSLETTVCYSSETPDMCSKLKSGLT